MQLLRTSLVAWLCVALALLIGLVPEKGFVVCFAQDGFSTIEIRAGEASCNHCEGHEKSSTPAQAAFIAGDDVPCPCIDVEVPGSPERELSQSRSIELLVGFWITLGPSILVQHTKPMVTAARGPPPCVPRVADSWAHIRAVVLLV